MISKLTRVVVLAGGISHERDVSLRSGRRVAEALRSAGFHLYRSPDPILSLDDLEGSPLVRTRIRGGFRTLAVGIDLSDMGFAEGESIRDLFIQDAADDNQRVDPVMIIGLPHGVTE